MIAGWTLTPRQVRTALDLVTAAAILSVALALAGLTWRVAGHAGTGAVTVPSGRSGPAAPTDIGAALALAPFGRGVVSDATAPTSLPLVLKGIVFAQPAELSTAFIEASGQPAAPFHIGQSVGGATIQGITRDRVILGNAGRVEYLTFPVPVAAPTPGQPQVPGQAAPPPAPTTAAPPPPATSQGGAPNLSAMLQRFNATPADGGYRIGANPPQGLSAGDVLLSVNGTQLSDPQAAGAAMSAAQASGVATIQILRSGKRLTLTVPIR
jgi:general secretion pathway protein C